LRTTIRSDAPLPRGRSVLMCVVSLIAACSMATPTPTLSVVGVAPSTVKVGARVTVTGAGFASSGNAVKIGEGYLLNLSSNDGSTIVFTLPGALELCAPGTERCSALAMEVRPGVYDLSVIVADQASNVVKLTVVE
jgi:hypothetical protein